LCSILGLQDLLESVNMASVTNYRASSDYATTIPGMPNYNVAGSGVLGHALGIRPSKDNFWTARPLSQIETGLPFPMSGAWHV